MFPLSSVITCSRCVSNDLPMNRRSVGRVPDYRAGGRGFKPRPDQHSGSLITDEKVLPLL